MGKQNQDHQTNSSKDQGQNSRLWVDQGRVESEPELLQWLCHRKNQLWQMFDNCKRGVWQGGGGSIIDQTSATITHQAAFSLLPTSDFGIGAIPNQLLACQQVPFDSFGLLSLDFSSFQWWQTQACGVLNFVQKARTSTESRQDLTHICPWMN